MLKPKALSIAGLELTFNMAVFAGTMIVGVTTFVTKTTMDLELIKKQLARIESKMGIGQTFAFKGVNQYHLSTD